MRRSLLLLSAAAAVCLALPAASLADQPSDNAKDRGGHNDQQHGQGQGRGQGKGQGGGQGQGGARGGSSVKGPTAGAVVLAPGGAGNAGGGAHGGSSGGAGFQTQQFQVRKGQLQLQQGQKAGQGTQATGGGDHKFSESATRRTITPVPNIQAQQFQKRGGQQPQAPKFQAPRQLPTPPPLANWNRTARGADRDRAGQQWRQGHQGWDRGALWRRDPNWWRQDSGFRLYVGPRAGYFFIPGLGYLLVPSQYRNHHWRAGEYLPSWFRLHPVREYWRYGLPRPPYGCIWVWLQGEVALVDSSDGYILDLVENIW